MLEQGAPAKPGDRMTPEEAIKDPFILEFLDLEDRYSESELEAALIQHLADILLELGDGFTFVGCQRRLRLDDTWFRVDLLLFHRKLKCLVVIDLKVGKFSHADAGQMHLYLNYAREHWMCEGENPPVRLILCTAKGAEEARRWYCNVGTMDYLKGCVRDRTLRPGIYGLSCFTKIASATEN
jgi:hypothetical protein